MKLIDEAAQNLTADSLFDDQNPAWSPDGQWIVFQSQRSGNWDIYKIRPDGTGLTRLTSDAADDWQPNWSPVGDRIIFQSKRTGYWDSWTMNPDSTDLRNITDDYTEGTDPCWSPDEMFVVYSSGRNDAVEPELWIVNTETQLPAVPTRITDNNAYDGAPSWSPDGKKVAFESNRKGNLDIWILELSMEPRLSQVQDFLYALQADSISIAQLTNNEFDLVVMDYAKFGDVDSEYTSREIAEIREGGTNGRQKIVLAYMSIGEAEDYRFYWNPNWWPGSPEWLGPTNPDWAGNYKIRFWMSGWLSR